MSKIIKACYERICSLPLASCEGGQLKLKSRLKANRDRAGPRSSPGVLCGSGKNNFGSELRCDVMFKSDRVVVSSCSLLARHVG